VLQQNPPFLNWRCQLTQIGHETVAAVIYYHATNAEI